MDNVQPNQEKVMVALFSEMSRYIFKNTSSENWILKEIEKPFRTLDDFYSILIKEKCDTYLIDLSMLNYPAENLADFFEKLQASKNTPTIIFAEGYLLQDPLVEKLRSNGFDLWVLSTGMHDMVTELTNCLNGVDIAVQKAHEKELEKKRIKETVSPGHRSISFAGVTATCGVSTQAIQYARYLLYYGYKVCYIESDNSNHIQKIPTIENVEYIDRELGYLQYHGLDMYYKPLKITPSIRMAYDVCIYDYGVLRTENIASFLSSTTNVCLASTVPWNIGKLRWAIDVLKEDEIVFLFPYSQSNEKENLKKHFSMSNHITFIPSFNNTIKFPILKENKELYSFLAKKLSIDISKKRRKKHEQ